ncbi:hypothetical protein GCM10010435_63930 [Winogradskya consettensis]|uniref:Uncharacterized protein n=1 Tax=Winogradskya consettensis TaxID=113560 RepID=A0A919W2E9_9ACTN|nr:hypothetical protein [Actinoplanes consettensis]GIM85362.1 hypothetical protein Aco04nite_95910 [Actinoplanes consettensis]
MTGAEFSEVDFDLLADYVGGALDGTPEEATVARLIADDPAWQDAYVELSASVGVISGALRSWGAEPEPMPDDIVARLDAVLLNADHAALLSADLAAPGSEPEGVTPVRHLVGVPNDRSRSKTARRLKWAAPIGIAAVFLGFLGFGLQQHQSSETASDSTAAEGMPQTLAVGPEIAEPLASGRNYTPETLAQSAKVPSGDARINGQDPAPRSKSSMADDTALSNLRVQDVLLACLDAIAGENGAGPITPASLDYARFQGVPALIVQFSATNGSWVWAAGADCGSPGSGAAKLAAVRVG